MKETGIVRKLDNLGRLVIPKEIRRCMRIKEGSPIEFGLLPTGEIVLCKYSLVNQISDYADEFCEILGQMFECPIIIGDRDKIISCYGISKKTMLHQKLSPQLLDILDTKMSYVSSVKDGTTIVPIIEDDKTEYISQLIFPIVIQGEKEGIIILCDSKNGYEFGESHITALKLVAKFLSMQLE